MRKHHPPVRLRPIVYLYVKNRFSSHKMTVNGYLGFHRLGRPPDDPPDQRNVADSPFAKLVLKAEELFRKRGGVMARSQLSNAIRIRPRELDEIILKLIEEEVIEIGSITGTVGRPKTVYRLLNHPNSPKYG